MTLNEFRNAFNAATSHGWLTLDEALILVSYVERTSGTIVEVGSYHGRSAMILACLNRKLVCIDPWADGFANTTGDENFQSFLSNIDSTGMSGCVTSIRSKIEDCKPIQAGFVYLDGDHTYPGTLAQIKWALQCKPQVIGIHDVNDTGGGKLIREAALELLGDWKEREGRLAIWELGQ